MRSSTRPRSAGSLVALSLVSAICVISPPLEMPEFPSLKCKKPRAIARGSVASTTRVSLQMPGGRCRAPARGRGAGSPGRRARGQASARVALPAIAARIPKTLPTTPSAGPPPHSPAEPKTFVIESTVARTRESSTLAFSHVEYTGAASERTTRAAQNATSATAKDVASAKASSATIRSESETSSVFAIPDGLSRDMRRESGWATRIASSVAPAASTPNHTTWSRPPKAGTPISTRNCASQSRSKPSSEAPSTKAMPATNSNRGLRLISEPPCLAVPRMDATADTLSARADTKPVSCMTAARPIARTRSAMPPATIGKRRSTSASATAAAIPTSEPMRIACAPA